jgi:hypothetical protein
MFAIIRSVVLDNFPRIAPLTVNGRNRARETGFLDTRVFDAFISLILFG